MGCVLRAGASCAGLQAGGKWARGGRLEGVRAPDRAQNVERAEQLPSSHHPPTLFASQHNSPSPATAPSHVPHPQPQLRAGLPKYVCPGSPCSAVLTKPRARTPHHPCQAHPHALQPQCATGCVQGQDDRSQGALLPRRAPPRRPPRADRACVVQLYCVRPNSGRVDPGETVEVQGARAPLALRGLLVLMRCAGRSRSAGPQGGAAARCQVQGQVPDPEHAHHAGEGDAAAAGYRASSLGCVARCEC